MSDESFRHWLRKGLIGRSERLLRYHRRRRLRLLDETVNLYCELQTLKATDPRRSALEGRLLVKTRLLASTQDRILTILTVIEEKKRQAAGDCGAADRVREWNLVIAPTLGWQRRGREDKIREPQTS